MSTASLVAWGLWLAIVAQRLVELRVAKRNEAWAREQGAVEHGAGHYPLLFVLHTGWLLAWPVEAWLHGPTLASGWIAGLCAFGLTQILRYWAITSLGLRWNTRILVLPGAARIRRGPYRFVPHPNYLAVVIELAVVPLIFEAWWTAAIVGVLNLALLLGVRIPAEVRALEHAESVGASRATTGS
ncbi:MAG: isoprenylcysteine carboxylmethyltransferase family protein [Myxococcota bacterium]